MNLTLMVFENSIMAHRAGFRGHRHPNAADLIAWWPSAGEASISAMRFPRIIISAETRLPGEYEYLLRSGQRVFENPIWIEL